MGGLMEKAQTVTSIHMFFFFFFFLFFQVDSYNMAMNGMVLWHNFVSGLDDHLHSVYPQIPPSMFELHTAQELNVSNNLANMYLHGQWGATLKTFTLHTLFTFYVTPDLVLLEFGTNDLAQGMHPVTVASQIFDLAEHLHQLYGSVVGVLSVLPRVRHLG